MSNLDKSLAAFLKQRRGEMTFAQFSRLTGLPVSTLFRLENNHQSITLSTLESLMKRLKVSLNDVFPPKGTGAAVVPSKRSAAKSKP